jgi:hypothetical protein
METLGAPVTAHNLTGWFILAPAPAPDHDYSVLEEAIESQTTLLHETGDVNELLIENTVAVDLFIQAGEAAGATEPPTADTITEWLAARELLESSHLDEERLPPRTWVRTHRGRSQHRFEVFDTALDAATPLHVTVLAE